MAENKCESILMELGLKEWEEKIKEILDIKDLAILMSADLEDFQPVLDAATNNIEKKGLQCFFDRVTSGKNKEEDDEKKERDEKAKQIANDAQSQANELGDHVSNNVKETIKACRVQSPTTFGHINPHPTSELDRLKKLQANGNTGSVAGEEWTAADTMHKASAGAACQGVFVTNDVNELVKDRRQVVHVSKVLEFSGARTAGTTYNREFQTQTSTHIFQNNIAKVGSSHSESASVGYFGVGVSASHGSSQQTEHSTGTSSDSTKGYVSVIHLEKTPVKSIYVIKNDLTLRPEVLEELQTIEKNISKSDDVKKWYFKSFFDAYGSHVSIGVIEFGGILMSKAETTYSNTADKATVSHMTAKASESGLSIGLASPSGFKCGVGVSRKSTEVYSRMIGTYTEDQLKNTKVTLSKVGGPVEIDDAAAWKKGLAERNSTWRVIDRGDQVVPIWELIRKHKEDFHDSSRMMIAMHHNWESITGRKAELPDNLSYQKLNTIMMKIEPLLSENDSSSFQDSLKIIESLREKGDVSNGDWYNNVLLDKSVQVYLSKATECMNNMKQCIEKTIITLSLTNILKPIDIIREKQFPGIQNIRKLIEQEHEEKCKSYSVRNMKELMQHIKEELEQLKRSSKHENELLGKMRHNLQKTMKVWLEKVQTDTERYDCLTSFIVLCYFGLIPKCCTFKHYLYQNDIQLLYSKLEETSQQLTEYSKSGDAKQLHAFIIYLCLCAPQNKHDIMEYVIDQLHRHVGLDKGIDSMITKWLSEKNSSKYFFGIQKKLQEVFNGPDMNDPTLIMQSLKQELMFNSTQGVNTDLYVSDNDHVPLEDESVSKLLTLLNLESYYPQKLTVAKIKELTADLIHDPKLPTKLDELPWYFLRNIMGVNSSTRELCHIKNDKAQSSDESSDTDDDTNSTEIALPSVHPLDLIAIIYMCADDFLRQEISDKMAKCQYAVPLILPSASCKTTSGHVLGLSLRSISREYSNYGRIEENSLVDVSNPIVSFVSLYDESEWQGKILNSFCTNIDHTFWYCGLKGGDTDQKVSNGMVELAWYLPSGRTDTDKFQCPVAFTALRGNASLFTKTRDLLLKESSVSCVFVDEISDETIDLMNNVCHIKKVILVVLHGESKKETIKSQKNKLSKEIKKYVITQVFQGKYFDMVLHKLEKLIQNLIPSCHMKSISEFVVEAKMYGFYLDDSKRECVTGKLAADRILKVVDDCNRETGGMAKRLLLPYQADLTSRIHLSVQHKELCRQKQRKGQKSHHDYAAEVEGNIWHIRLQLLDNHVSEAVHMFLQVILTSTRMVRQHFLQWLQQGLDARSRTILQPLFEQYIKLRDTMENDPNREVNLKRIATQLSDSSIGLEHFLRELVQIYENIEALKNRIDCSDLDEFLDKLTDTVADMLVDGMALEIMDGDVCSVPISWVTAILEKVKQKVGKIGLDKHESKLCTVSILGAQSSGKSTILNTAFGLRFPVSSGRCTKGAYLQLVKVASDLKRQIRCDYVAVIDTEGLMSRATAHDIHRHDYDNELSTLIIGMSDLTLVVIKGEGNEMQAVLPMALHAFLRMNTVGENQGCHFIHQNMGAVAAMTKNATEIDKFLVELNKMTKAAAEHAERSGHYKKFTDILAYDPNKDNTYAPGLWDGSPPMGKVSEHYAMEMRKLKCIMIQRLMLLKTNRSFSGLSKRVDDLWDAIKHENFIFSFSNVLAIQAYKNLAIVYSKRLNSMKTNIRDQLKAKVNNIKNKAQVDKAEYGEIHKWIHKYRKELLDNLAEESDKLEKQIKHYFECTGCDNKDCSDTVQDRHLLTSHQAEFTSEIKDIKREMADEVKSSLLKLEQNLMAETKNRNLTNTMDANIKNKVFAVIKTKDCTSYSRDEFEKLFETLWADATGDLHGEAMTSDDIYNHIERQVENALDGELKIQQKEHLYQSRLKVYNSKKVQHMQTTSTKGYRRSNQLYKKQPPMPTPQNTCDKQRSHTYIFQVDYKTKGRINDHICIKKGVVGQLDLLNVWHSICEQDNIRLQREADIIIKNSVPLAKEGEAQQFEAETAEKLFKNVFQNINNIQDDRFTIKPEFAVDLAIHIQMQAILQFTKLHTVYIEKNDPFNKLNDLKKDYKKVFMTVLGQGDAATKFCEGFIHDLLYQNVEDHMDKNKLAYYVKKYVPEKLRDVREIQCQVLLDLWKRDNFDDYIGHIKDYKGTTIHWIRQQCENYFLPKQGSKDACNYIKHAIELLEQFKRKVSKALEKTNDTSPKDGILKVFSTCLDGLKVDSGQLDAYSHLEQGLPDTDMFISIVLEKLDGPVMDTLKKEIHSWNVEEILDSHAIASIIFDDITKCSETCPFCKAPCDIHSNTNRGDHSTTLHRPDGIGGYHWRQTQKLSMDSCCISVGDDKFTFYENGKEILYKDYRKVYPNWTIRSDTIDHAIYWQKVLAKYHNEFAEYYCCVKGDLPPSWHDHSVSKIKESLEHWYHTSDLDM